MGAPPPYPRAWLLILLAVGCGVRLGSPAEAPGQPSGAPCATAKDCPRPTSPCFIAVCEEGACQSQVATAGVVPAEQKAGDCQELVCDGRGQAISREDRNDVPASDDNDCTEERCSAGAPDHASLAAGEACGSGGLCNGGGICGVCLPGKRKCDGNAAALCEERGQWSEPAGCQGAQPVCSQGVCAGLGGLSLGAHHTCAALSDGTARCWGKNRDRQIEGQSRRQIPISGVLALALGDDHTCAQVSGGTVKCWGSNASGELGDGSADDQAMPVDVTGLRGVAQIAAGAGHTCARLGDGTVVCWGRNQVGQLGDGGGAAAAVPKQATAPRSSGGSASSKPEKMIVTGRASMLEVALGGDRSCARYQDLTVDCWGANDIHPRATPRPGGAAPVRPAPAGPRPAAPGAAPAPPLAQAKAQPPTPKFKPVRGLKGVAQIALGGDHSCARLGDGTVQCWGDNAKGQIGDGTSAARRTPTKIKGLAGVAEVALGRDHTCARLGDGTVQCWGGNGAGQLGDGAKADRKVPAPVGGLAGVVALMAGGDRTCARLSSGVVKCWGDNADGALGDGTKEDRPVPVAVAW